MSIRPELRKGIGELSRALQEVSSAERRSDPESQLNVLRWELHMTYERVIRRTAELSKRLSALSEGEGPTLLSDDVAELLDIVGRQFNELPSQNQRMLPRILDDHRYELETVGIMTHGRETMSATTNRIAKYFRNLEPRQPQKPDHPRGSSNAQWSPENRIKKYFID